MKKRTAAGVLAIFLSAIMLVACKPSEEKLNEAETARSLLVEAKNSAEETYLDITDSSYKDKLDELGQKEAEYEKVDFSRMSNKKIDAMLPEIAALTDEYQNLGRSLDEIYTSEKKESDEASKHMGVGSYIINKTDFGIIEVKLHDITQDTYSDNLIGDGVVLEPGFTLMGIVFDINKDSSEWEIIVKDHNNTTHNFECGDMKTAGEEGLALVLRYDSAAGKGSAEVGNYTDL